jgi:very-short-patch-repair endonuclease
MKDNIDSLDDWTRYQDALQECQKEGLADFVDKVILMNFPLERIVNAFECQFLRCWLDRVFSEREPLKKFYGEDHEKLIEKFCEIDKRQIELAKIRIQHTLSGRFDSNYIPSKSSELGVLLREGRKTRAHLPIRKLFELASTAIINLKPCLMMSPLTVAQFINPELIKFDLVIFDEASQIPPEDSIGPILRGKQIVIAGDSKQLPPTTFFQSEVLTPEDEDDISIETLPEDLDSILDECAVSGIPKTMLRWHYRSKHESLIAFSNKNFYSNRLFTFPCAEEECPELGIKFHYNPTTVYDRGGKGTNIEEAIEVAKAVFKHFKENPALSLGIGTFSIRQKYAIEDAIEEMLKEDNSLEAFFAKDRPEHFFIKNLETIQGDERDVIFISVGYGRDQKGRLSMNFGPINQVGGARRLNVLVTRARKRLEIFSSIRGDDFDLSKTDSEGVHLLKGYLDFAEKGKFALLRGITEEGVSESPFEESVYNLLITKGIKVQKQIGCSGYRIDLAVVDDNLPGKYILGIECDGAHYHSSSTARDRDRLRQQVLEELNWNLCRIWSTDWFKNPRKEFERLLNAIEKARRGEFSKKKLKINSEYKILYKTPTNKPNSQVKDYLLTPIQSKSYSDSFYWAGTSKIASVLKKIVEYEGPIHKEEAWRRVVQHWDIRAVGSRIRQILESAEDYCTSKKMIKKKGEFYWPINMIKPFVRRRDSEEITKDIHLIDPEEIGEAALIVLKTEYSMPKDDLINQAARLLGFARVTEDISKYIWKSIDVYKKCNNILEINERFTFNADKEKGFEKKRNLQSKK